ncbi:MAG: hypothetical protein EAY75_06915 [Bacteroidetes bacterium]|jgi:hypothetical protein|nr:MAG: hypothetical protein EAY75_06915 [Bacteroidota bacterium]
MKVLGIRNSPTKIRFSIIEGDATTYVFINHNGENKIDMPKSLKTEAEIFQWVKSEFKRIFDKYGPFDHMAIKQNENVPTRYSSVRPVMFLDCLATMVAIENNTPFSSHIYTSIGTKSKEVVSFVESKVTKSTTNWDSQMADAIAAAIKNLK